MTTFMKQWNDEVKCWNEVMICEAKWLENVSPISSNVQS